MKRKNSVNVSIRMDAEINELLEKHCEASGQSKTAAIERALKMYIADYSRKMLADSRSEERGEN